MHHKDQQIIRKIAISLLCLHPEHQRGEIITRRIFSVAKAVVEAETGTIQSASDHEKMLKRFVTPK